MDLLEVVMELDLISLKQSIPYVFSHYYTKMKVDSYDYLPEFA